MTMDEVEAGVRELSWELRILRDRVLVLVDRLPGAERERILEISQRMTAADVSLRAVMARAPSDSESDFLLRLRDTTTEIQGELALIARDLFDVADGLPHEPDWPEDAEQIH